MSTGTQTEVVMPQMGVSVSEGTVTKWLRQVGEPIQRDEPLLEISTDKVDTEVPSPAEGVVAQILVPEGETVEVGTVLALIAPAGAEIGAPETAPEAPLRCPPLRLPSPSPPLPPLRPPSHAPAAELVHPPPSRRRQPPSLLLRAGTERRSFRPSSPASRRSTASTRRSCRVRAPAVA